MTLAEAVTLIKKPFGEAILSESVFRDEQTVSVKMESLRDICKFCRSELGFD